MPRTYRNTPQLPGTDCTQLRVSTGEFPGLPLLSGEGLETIFAEARHTGIQGNIHLYQNGQYTLGWASLPTGAASRAASRTLYSELLQIAGAGLCRVWNYVPGINATCDDGREGYQHFCQGRAEAFEHVFGDAFEQGLPAASAVGTDAQALGILFAAHPGRATHFENPLQTPAYRYPAEYGPRPPSFARATLVEHNDGLQDLFISGTASIRGSASIAPFDTAAQLDCTLENMEALCASCGVGSLASATPSHSRHLKVYLREAKDLSLVSGMLQDRLIQAGDRVSYLRADICRRDLMVEIELTALANT